MAIQKQEFYEGAALRLLIRNNASASFRYSAPFFVVNDALQLYLKYSTGVRSPWGFTFTNDEQRLIHSHAGATDTIIGLICGSDGVATLPSADFARLVAVRDVPVRIACHRKHRQYFEITGPDGVMGSKVAPSEWQRLILN
jgi:hypothetical protein